MGGARFFPVRSLVRSVFNNYALEAGANICYMVGSNPLSKTRAFVPLAYPHSHSQPWKTIVYSGGRLRAKPEAAAPFVHGRPSCTGGGRPRAKPEAAAPFVRPCSLHRLAARLPVRHAARVRQAAPPSAVSTPSAGTHQRRRAAPVRRAAPAPSSRTCSLPRLSPWLLAHLFPLLLVSSWVDWSISPHVNGKLVLTIQVAREIAGSILTSKLCKSLIHCEFSESGKLFFFFI